MGCLTFRLPVGAERPRRKTEAVNSEELQVREFHISLSEVGALAADKAVKLWSAKQEPARRKYMPTNWRTVVTSGSMILPVRSADADVLPCETEHSDVLPHR